MSARILALVLVLAPSLGRAAKPTILDELPESLRVGPNGRPLTLEQIRDLISGKVIADSHSPDDQDIREGVAMVLVDATPAAVIEVLRDFPHFQDFMPRIVAANVDQHDGDAWLVSFQVRTPLGLGDRRYQMRIVEQTRKVDGRKVWEAVGSYTGQGNIRTCTASWTLVSILAGARTFVIYKSRFDPGLPIAKSITSREIDKGMQNAIEAVRDRASRTR